MDVNIFLLKGLRLKFNFKSQKGVISMIGKSQMASNLRFQVFSRFFLAREKCCLMINH